MSLANKFITIGLAGILLSLSSLCFFNSKIKEIEKQEERVFDIKHHNEKESYNIIMSYSGLSLLGSSFVIASGLVTKYKSYW